MRAILRSAAAVLTAAALIVGPTALAKNKVVLREGSCSKASSTKMKLNIDNGLVKSEYEVDQRPGRNRWRVVLRHDGRAFLRTERFAGSPSGSFTIRKRVNNTPGGDRIRGRAVNLRTGETCVAVATI